MSVIKEVSKKQEKRMTKTMKEIQDSVKRVPGSGCLWQAKSDVVSEDFRIECKTKVKPSASISIKKEWFDKIEIEALQTDKTPVLAVSFGDGTDYMILKDKDFINMVQELKELRRLAAILRIKAFKREQENE